jgi:hypothetical protein
MTLWTHEKRNVVDVVAKDGLTVAYSGSCMTDCQTWDRDVGDAPINVEFPV